VRQRLVYLAGASSSSGDGRRQLAGLLHYLAAQAGVDEQVEASYRATADGVALPYERVDTSRPLAESRRAVAALLGRQRRELGVGGRLHLLGWSLGGVVLFEAAADLFERDASWRDAFASIVTLASPLNGCDVVGLTDLGSAAAGEAGRELCARGGDPGHRRRVAEQAARLRDFGVRVLTLGSADDAVVTAEDAVVPPIGEPIDRYVLRTRPPPGADWRARNLGHGALRDDPTAWRLILDAVRGL
jgi:pimeloyl-ACP methyl ester carboxylesterase